MPYHQVIRFHVIADSTAEMTRSWVATSRSTIPLPTVVATAVPVSAPTTLSASHQRCDRCGKSAAAAGSQVVQTTLRPRACATRARTLAVDGSGSGIAAKPSRRAASTRRRSSWSARQPSQACRCSSSRCASSIPSAPARMA